MVNEVTEGDNPVSEKEQANFAKEMNYKNTWSMVSSSQNVFSPAYWI